MPYLPIKLSPRQRDAGVITLYSLVSVEFSRFQVARIKANAFYKYVFLIASF